MASFHGTAGKRKGSVGGETYSIRKGVNVVKAKAVEVSNPRTSAQVMQRSLFMDAVKFYKQSQQAMFAFAYEDKAANETDYNAFMRHNAKLGINITSTISKNNAAPALGNWMVATGSLASPQVAFDSANDPKKPSLYVDGITASGTTTIGTLSAALIAAYGLVAGDIVTIGYIKTQASDLLAVDENNEPGFELENETAPQWTLQQFRIDESSAKLLTNYNFSVVDGQLYFGSAVTNCACAAFVVFSRVTDDKTLVSNSECVWDSMHGVAQIHYAKQSVYTDAVKKWWGATDAILKGSLVL